MHLQLNLCCCRSSQISGRDGGHIAAEHGIGNAVQEAGEHQQNAGPTAAQRSLVGDHQG